MKGMTKFGVILVASLAVAGIACGDDDDDDDDGRGGSGGIGGSGGGGGDDGCAPVELTFDGVIQANPVARTWHLASETDIPAPTNAKVRLVDPLLFASSGGEQGIFAEVDANAQGEFSFSNVDVRTLKSPAVTISVEADGWTTSTMPACGRLLDDAGDCVESCELVLPRVADEETRVVFAVTEDFTTAADEAIADTDITTDGYILVNTFTIDTTGIEGVTVDASSTATNELAVIYVDVGEDGTIDTSGAATSDDGATVVTASEAGEVVILTPSKAGSQWAPTTQPVGRAPGVAFQALFADVTTGGGEGGSGGGAGGEGGDTGEGGSGGDGEGGDTGEGGEGGDTGEGGEGGDTGEAGEGGGDA